MTSHKSMSCLGRAAVRFWSWAWLVIEVLCAEIMENIGLVVMSRMFIEHSAHNIQKTLRKNFDERRFVLKTYKDWITIQL